MVVLPAPIKPISTSGRSGRFVLRATLPRVSVVGPGHRRGPLNRRYDADRLSQTRHIRTLPFGAFERPQGVAPLDPCRLPMSKAPFILLVVVTAVVVGGAVFLATWDIPPPTKTVEKPIPDDRLPR